MNGLGASKPSVSGMRYRPIIALGQGGMADVLLSVGRGPSGFSKLVVLKTMKKELVADDELRQMFLAEARLSARLNNANVVQVHEVLDTALPCIVMEYLEGQPLSSVLYEAGDSFTVPFQLKVLSDALAGLHYSHELKDFDGTSLNLVHRDVSPQNIFVTYDGVVKLLDFGIAKASNVSDQTRTGVIKGKLAYMPREQLLAGDIDRRADVYSVGCILWHAAAGRKLWSNASEGEIMRALIDGAIPRPSEVRPVDPELEAMVMKALAPDPKDRYSTALEMRRAIDQYLARHSPGTTMREVGEVVSEVFADQQAARAKQIQTLLQGPRSEAPPPIPEGIEPIIQTSPGDTSTKRDNPRGGGLTWIMLTVSIVAVLVAVGTVGFPALRGTRTQAAQPSALAPVAKIQVRLTASPTAATLTVDGNAVSGNPALLTVARDERNHEIRAVLAGYEPYQELVHFDRDLSIEIMLHPEAPRTPASVESSEPARKEPSQVAVNKKRNAAAATSRPQTSVSTKAKENCDPPYTFANGIKTYKTGCLVTGE